MKFANNILETIGNTPLIRLNNVVNGIKATILAKVEYFNPGGSVKDRIGLGMIEDAEKKGLLKPGGTIVEPTSGNTGVGLALVAAMKGYKTVFVMPDKMSVEKIKLLKAYGARVVITPTAVERSSPESYYSVAERLSKEIPGAFQPNQYFNQKNPEAHYKTTGPEIWTQTDGKIDYFVAGMGTGGTITGVAKYLKEKNPKIKIIGADPEGSIYSGDTPRPYKTEGIGEDFIPGTIDLSLIDEIVRVGDRESFLMTRKLAKEEGLLVGGSSGTAVVAALKIAKDLPEGKIVVVLLPDSGRSYLSKIFSDEWMKENSFLPDFGMKISDVLKSKKERAFISLKSNNSVEDAINAMKEFGISQIPVIDGDKVVGCVLESVLFNQILSGKTAAAKKISDAMDKPPPEVDINAGIEKLFEVLSNAPAALVIEKNNIVGILTKIDIIEYLSKGR